MYTPTRNFVRHFRSGLQQDLNFGVSPKWNGEHRTVYGVVVPK